VIARRDRYRRLEFVSACGAVQTCAAGSPATDCLMLGYSRFSHRHSSPDACWSERTTLSGDTGASTRSPRNIEISAKIPVPDLWGQCQHTDWIAFGLFWGRHWGLLVQLLVVARGAPFIRALGCLTRFHTALATGTSRHSACGREWGTVQPGWCLTRSHSGRWSDNRQ